MLLLHQEEHIKWILEERLKARLHEWKKWNGSDKKWNGSDKFLRVNDTWPIPVLPVPLKKGR